MKVFQVLAALAVAAFTAATSPATGDKTPGRRASYGRHTVNGESLTVLDVAGFLDSIAATCPAML